MALLKFLVITLGVYYLLKLIIRALFPFLVQKTYNKMQQEYRQKHQGKKKEGEVTIQNTKQKQNNENKKNLGEYVDYEEVE